MNWNELYPKIRQPQLCDIAEYVNSPLWDDLAKHLNASYEVPPRIEHSICSFAPGWNVKYKKSGRALCTLYPADGYFTALVSVASGEAMEAELILSGCTEYLQKLYWNTKPFNGGRWLMIEVRTLEILEDVKSLIELRVHKKRQK